MRHSASSTTRILTIFSLVVLCTLSFAVVYGTQNIVDTPPQQSFHKRNVPHHRRAIHHLRASHSAQVSDSSSLIISSTPSPTPSDSPSPSVRSKSKSPIATSVPSPASASPSTDSSASPAKSTSTSDTIASTTPSTSSTPSSTSSSTSSSTPSSGSATSSPSSNTSPTTSAAPGVSNPVIGGSTTRLLSNSPVTSSLFFTPSNPTSTIYASSTAGANSSGFFANKAAVGVTFGIVGAICGLAAIMVAVTLIRRYRRANDGDDDFYEKYPGAGGSADHFPREHPELGQGPLGASATDFGTDAAPPNAYPDRAIHYGQPNPSTVFRPVDYGIDYPPNAAYADPVAAPGSAYENYDYDPRSIPDSPASHPFADPANAPLTAYAPQVTYPRPVHGRAQDVVTTDSYYGPNTAGVGAGIAQ